VSHELERIRAEAQRIVDEDRRGLLITVVGTRGSTYRRPGARAVIADDGAICGAISGGCLERDLSERFRAYADDFTPRVITYDSSRSDDIVFGLGLGCRGEMDVLVEPFDAEHPPRLPGGAPPPPAVPFVWTTVIRSSNPAYAVGDRFPLSRLDAAEGGGAPLKLIDGCEVLVETIRPARRVALFGGGPDVVPVATIARASGFTVDAIAPREVHPEQVAEKVDLNAYDAAVVMTHNYLYDLALLRALLPSAIGYIGLLGPRKRGDELLAELGGVTPEQRARIHNPIGLDLGGDSPEQIGLSIVAEMQAAVEGRSGRPLRESESAIHAEVEPPHPAVGHLLPRGRRSSP
jgi:xanthine/CO dehydrogenase XdhC/CoxF family maturation factor